MQNKKIAAIALIIAITLSAFGFVYAHWSDQITIEGNVKMGGLTLVFDWFEPPHCVEYFLNHSTGALQEGEYLGKDVGSCSVVGTDNYTDPHTGKYGWRKLLLTINNAYPQYRVHTKFVLHNIGTVPLDIKNYTVSGEKRDSTGAFLHNLLMNYTGIDARGYWTAQLWEDLNDNGIIDPPTDKEVINVYFSNAIPYQIDPCNTNKAEIDLEFKQDAEQCHKYTIHAQVLAIQWNKD